MNTNNLLQALKDLENILSCKPYTNEEQILLRNARQVIIETEKELMFEDKKPPSEWAKKWNITVLDPDGWIIDKKSWDDPISEHEFFIRAEDSTCCGELKGFEIWHNQQILKHSLPLIKKN